MEEVESKALSSFKGTAPHHWFRYVDDTWVKIQTREVGAFTEHINSEYRNIKFRREDAKDSKMYFWTVLRTWRRTEVSTLRFLINFKTMYLRMCVWGSVCVCVCMYKYIYFLFLYCILLKENKVANEIFKLKFSWVLKKNVSSSFYTSQKHWLSKGQYDNRLSKLIYCGNERQNNTSKKTALLSLERTKLKKKWQLC